MSTKDKNDLLMCQFDLVDKPFLKIADKIITIFLQKESWDIEELSKMHKKVYSDYQICLGDKDKEEVDKPLHDEVANDIHNTLVRTKDTRRRRTTKISPRKVRCNTNFRNNMAGDDSKDEESKICKFCN